MSTDHIIGALIVLLFAAVGAIVALYLDVRRLSAAIADRDAGVAPTLPGGAPSIAGVEVPVRSGQRGRIRLVSSQATPQIAPGPRGSARPAAELDFGDAGEPPRAS